MTDEMNRQFRLAVAGTNDAPVLRITPEAEIRTDTCRVERISCRPEPEETIAVLKIIQERNNNREWLVQVDTGPGAVLERNLPREVYEAAHKAMAEAPALIRGARRKFAENREQPRHCCPS